MKKLILLSALIALPTISQAEKGEPGTGVNPYTQCGIGASLFKNHDALAAISNVIWDLGTTALASALSSPEMCNAKNMKTAQYILETLPELEANLAAGEGEYLTGLAETMDCSATSLTPALRAQYAQAVTTPAYAEGSQIDRATTMYNAAQTAAASCTL